MRLGIDIASLAYQKIVNQIILIGGDADFVPALKLARKLGIEIVLDPLTTDKIRDSLSEHIDYIEILHQKIKGYERISHKNEAITNNMH